MKIFSPASVGLFFARLFFNPKSTACKLRVNLKTYTVFFRSNLLKFTKKKPSKTTPLKPSKPYTKLASTTKKRIF